MSTWLVSGLANARPPDAQPEVDDLVPEARQSEDIESGSEVHSEAQSSETQSSEAQSSEAQSSEAQPSEAQSSEAQPSETQSSEAQPDLHEEEAANTPDSDGALPALQALYQRREPWFSISGHGSFLGDLISRSTIIIRAGYSLSGGVRFGRWGIFASLEHNWWMVTEREFGVERGVFSVALGADVLYFDRLRASVAIGAAVLLEDQAFDAAGHTGVFFWIRPAGIRFPVSDSWTFMFDPMSLAIVAPVLGTPSIVDIEYRTTLTVEWGRPRSE